MRKLLKWIVLLLLACSICGIIGMFAANRGGKATPTPTTAAIVPAEPSATLAPGVPSLTPAPPTAIPPTKTPAPTARPKPTPMPALELLESSVDTREYSRYIVGKVRNNSKKQYGYVQVQFTLYDAAGNQVGSSMANVNDLEPGGIWAFEALIFEDRATNYKFSALTGF
jgi:hypothetical protein